MSFPGVKTEISNTQENLSLTGSAPRPLPSYATFSFDNNPNFLLDYDPQEGGFPETPGYVSGIIIPNPALTEITSNAAYEDPENPGTTLKAPIAESDYLVDPSNPKILQVIIRKAESKYELDQTVNRIAIYTAEDVLLYIMHIYPTIFGEQKLNLKIRHEYISERTLEGLKAGDIDKLVMVDGRVESIAENIAKMQGLMVDYTVGSEIQKNEHLAIENVEDIDTLSGKVHVLEGDHEIGTKTISNIEFSRHFNGNINLVGKRASGFTEITNNTNIDGDTFRINGVDFVEGTDFTKGATKELSAEALKDAINASSDPLLSDITASLLGAKITTFFGTIGIAGNSCTLGYTDSGSGVSAAISGPNFTGGTDYSVLTINGTAKGPIKVINAADNSVVVNAHCEELSINTDNVDCLDFTGTGTVVINGVIHTGNPRINENTALSKTSTQLNETVDFKEGINKTPTQINETVDFKEGITQTPTQLNDTVDFKEAISKSPTQINDTVDFKEAVTLTPTQINGLLGDIQTVDQKIDSTIAGLDPKESVIDEIDFTTAEPATPSDGDRFINTVTGDSSQTTTAVTAKYIYQWDTDHWIEIIPDKGTYLQNETTERFRVFDGTDWVNFGSFLMHNSLGGLNSGDYRHLTEAEHTTVSETEAKDETDTARRQWTSQRVHKAISVNKSIVPVGSIIGIHPSIDPAKALDAVFWAYCDNTGDNLTITYPDGTTTSIARPNLTDSRFLMGGTALGTGGSNTMLDHKHTYSLIAAGQTGGSHRHNVEVEAHAARNISTTPSGTYYPHKASGGYQHRTNYVSHTHNASDVSGTIGVNSYPSSTNSRPLYFTVKFFMRIK